MNQVETLLIGEQPAPQESPATYAVGVALLVALCGVVMAVGGVLLLFGTGWALIAASVPALVLAALMFRGLTRGG